MLTLSTWNTPASSYPDSQVGRARIKSIPCKRGYYEAYGLRGVRVYRAARPLPIQTLTIDGATWMVDDPPHWWAMEDHATHYHGTVLCAGLGLGLIVHTLTANPKVEKIVVVERERDVIDLVLPHLPRGKLKVIHGDFWEYNDAADGVFYDLFVGDGRELAMEALHVFVQLAQEYPRPIRIHGFNNDYFDRMWDAIGELSAEAGRSGLTGDGYYGIMATTNSVFLGNGCEEVLDDEEIAKLKIIPINVFHEGVTAASNFLDLVENRAPCQEIENQRREAAHMRAEMDDVYER